MVNKGSLLKKSALLQQLLKSVVYNKYDIIAINKPYGLPVQGDTNYGLTLSGLLEDFARAKGLKTKPHLANRLDRDCTGVLLLSSSQISSQYLAEMFRERKIKKTYWSVVVGTPRYEGNICIPLKEDMVNGRFKIVLSTEDHNQPEANLLQHVKTTQTNFKILSNNKQTCSLLELNPITGHKHQLRVHLSKGLGTPILGDHKYWNEQQQPQVLPLRLLQMLGFKGIENQKTGKRKIQPWQRALIPLHLHAKQVMLPELENKQVIIKAPLPDFFKITLSSLRLDLAQTKQKTTKREKQDRNLRELGISRSYRAGF